MITLDSLANHNYQKKSNASKKCYKFTEKGEFIQEYTSAVEAAEDNKMHSSALFKAIKKNLAINGFRYQYKRKFDTYKAPQGWF